MQNSLKKTILITSGIIVGLFTIYRFATAFAPGSYPYAETYTIDAGESRVIHAIDQFKMTHPELLPPKDLKDGREGTSDYWYHIYFYVPEKEQIFHVWTRPAEEGKTTLAFVGVNNGLTLGHWKEVNKDFNSLENKELKSEFEQRILDSIKQGVK